MRESMHGLCDESKPRPAIESEVQSYGFRHLEKLAFAVRRLEGLLESPPRSLDPAGYQLD